MGLGGVEVRRRADLRDGQPRMGGAVLAQKGASCEPKRPVAIGPQKVEAMPDPTPLLSFAEAVKTRGKPGGHAEAAHRCAAMLHLANITIRVRRKIKYDPVKEEIIGDLEANRFVNPPTRAPWHL